MQYEALAQKFHELYGKGEARIFIGPARVNLIGEHTDYNGGYVFPCALEMRSACVARRRDDGKIQIASTSYPKIVTAYSDRLDEYRSLEWGSYQLGVLYMMQKAGYPVTGYDMLFDETVPHGTGLSSSAAIEMATAMAAATLAGADGPGIDKVKLACIGQKAENEYVGMNCGIMDQFASAMGKKGHAILLRCSDLDYSYIPFDIEKQGYSLIIASTNKPRSLITSKYNERRSECERALKDIQAVQPRFSCLGELTNDEFELYADAIKNKVDRKRAKHVVYENNRTKESVNFLRAGNILAFGKCMCQSHESLRDLYEVTGPELDALYESALGVKGVIGTRMTGAGFGGCTVSIVDACMADEFKENVAEIYFKRTGLSADFYFTAAADGVREVIL